MLRCSDRIVVTPTFIVDLDLRFDRPCRGSRQIKFIDVPVLNGGLIVRRDRFFLIEAQKTRIEPGELLGQVKRIRTSCVCKVLRRDIHSLI